MNNGKVRIYELSKELNLENKDILAVCDQLNISVKSHSSTITDTEADRIRAAAEKALASPSAPNKPTPPSSKTVSQQRQVSKPAIVKKPQILEIRRYQSAPSAEPQPADGVEQNLVPAPPDPSETQDTPSQPNQSPRLNAPTRPARSTPAEEAPVSDVAPVQEPPKEPAPVVEVAPVVADAPSMDVLEVVAQPEPTQTPEPAVRDEPAPTAETPTAAQPAAAKPATAKREELKREESKRDEPAPIAVKMVERPALSGPPSRAGVSAHSPASFTPNSGGESPRPSSRPVLRNARTESGEPPTTPSQRGPLRKQSPTTQSGEGTEVLERRRDRPSAPSDSSNQGPPRSPTPELRRPQPIRPGAGPREAPSRNAAPTAGGAGDDAAQSVEVIGLDDLRLRRPTPPRVAAKKTKEWEDGEDEVQDFPQKAAKAATKGKRRGPVVEDDDDEDLTDGLDGVEPLVQVSLSLARPAKPKSRPGQIKPVTSAPISVAQRGERKSGSSRSERRERRAEEVKPERPEKITLTGSLTVQELAETLAVQETELIKTLFFKGIAANINQVLDVETIIMLAQEMGVEVETVEKKDSARKVTEMLDASDLENLIRRPPVVTIMGHVDHGKTTLLDAIRKTKVAQGEAGGITQHIGAYHVDVEHEGKMQQVVFLDTPGHQAFTAMRARGARVTDIAVLVVAADDGVQPQTIEAISHAKAAEVPIVVAINKIDKESAQQDRVKNELMSYELVPEEFGGDTIMVPVSAMAGTNLDLLLEMILLVAEVEDLYANPNRSAKGTVIEAHLDKARGPVATFLVQNGTLRVGDTLVAGSALGKVKAMVDDRGKRVDAAAPSFAVEVLGLSEVPAAGDDFEVFQDEKEARALASVRTDQQRISRLQQQALGARRVTLNSLSASAQEGELKELNLILKADVQGSIEAILSSLKQLPQNEVQLRVLLSAPGEVTETDVDLAAASSAVILAFNTTYASGARQAADQAGVDVREYNIIYKLLDDVQGAMEGLLDPEMIEEFLGQVEVRAVFPVGKGSVAGCYVLSGKVVRNANVRVRRGSQVIYEGVADSLKRMKEDAKEVNAGYECGIGINSFNEWAVSDIIEVFRMVSKRRTLSPN